jgi:hypothetical protein
MPCETVRWTVSNHEAQVVCVERAADSDFELHVRYCNLPIASRRCVDPEEAARWSDEIRCAWEAAGWK